MFYSLLSEPTTEILGGPELFIDQGSTINLTCLVQFAPEPPPTVGWTHEKQVSGEADIYTMCIYVLCVYCVRAAVLHYIYSRQRRWLRRMVFSDLVFEMIHFATWCFFLFFFSCAPCGSQPINFDSPRGGISLVTEKGSTTSSRLLIQKASSSDTGYYSCDPSNANSATIRVHILNGWCRPYKYYTLENTRTICFINACHPTRYVLFSSYLISLSFSL